MFCPTCESEYRPGIAQCPACDVALVEAPSVAAAPPPDLIPALPTTSIELGDYCGFETLDEARQARASLRNHKIPSEITIRDGPGPRGSVIEEEYWLRVPMESLGVVARILGFDPAESAHADGEGAMLDCSECGKPVGGQESACPHCGATFDE